MKKNFIEELIASYPRARPWIALSLVIAVTTAPGISNQAYRISVTAVLAVTLLFISFDIYRELLARLSAIEGRLRQPDPPHYKNFNDALPSLELEIVNRLNANRDVRVRILAVTAQFSWKSLVEDKIETLLEMGNKTQNISIELAYVRPSLLSDWKQEKLMADATRTLKGIEIFRTKWKHAMDSNRISLDVYEYDNMAHWHGILIDDDTLFFGRTRWIIRGESLEFTIGTNAYRRFSKGDPHHGDDRIMIFTNWFEAYKIRSKMLTNHGNS